LLDSAELKAIGRFDGEIRRFLYNICLPFEIGIHLLPIQALEMVEQRLRAFRSDREALVQSFLAAYPGLCQDAARRLRGLYNPADYPPVEEVAREFGFSWQYVSFGVPEQLKGISREVFEQEREKAAQRMAEASSEIQQVLRETMARLVQHMADRLKDSADGKPLRFKESTVSNLVEFLANFQFRNVTDDAELQRMVGQARDLLQGVKADDLRSTGSLRSHVQQGMAEIAGRLDTMLVKGGGRKFRFEEEVQ
jgi:ribosomal protein S15P/S13E